MRKKAEEQAASTTGHVRVTPADVQQVEFRLAFRGYNERDVDAFLDRVTEDLASYIEENRRLRSETGPVPAPGDEAAAARTEAERIIAEARAQAARIVGEAEAQAALAGAATGDARAAVAPFLNTEREFLQGLGALVQGHAEEIKQMVLTLREMSEGSTVPTSGPQEAASVDRAPGAGSEDAEVERSARGEEEGGAMPKAEGGMPKAEEAYAPIELPDSPEVADAEPEPASEPAAAQLRRDSGDRSLRELFWGED